MTIQDTIRKFKNAKDAEDFDSVLEDISKLKPNDLCRFFIASKFFEFSKSKYDFISAFWKSKIPNKYQERIIQCEIIDAIALSYFKDLTNISDDFSKALFNKNPDVAIQQIKRSGCFFDDEWFKHLTQYLSNTNTIVFKELSYIRNITLKYDNDETYYSGLIQAFPLSLILSQASEYFNKKKNTKEYLASHIQIINYIIKIRNINNSKQGESNKLLSEQQEILVEIFDFFMAKLQTENYISKYLLNLYDFEMIDNLYAELRENKNGVLYKFNDNKNRYLDNYFTEEINPNNGFIKNAVKVSVKYFDFNKLPLQYKSKRNNHKIDFEKIFELLHTFSLYLDKQEAPTNFKKLFGTGLLFHTEHPQLITNISEYFEWASEEVEQIVDFLTLNTDLKTIHNADITITPFVKSGDKIIWISNLMKNVRWSVQMHQRLLQTDYNHTNAEDQKSLEKEIADKFTLQNFNALSSYKYKNGEIDAIAYKNGYLFLIELKSTFFVEDAKRMASYFETKIRYAQNQLLRGEKDIRDNFEEYKKLLKIDLPFEKLKIIPIVVSNTFDNDRLLNGNNIFSISLIELFIILTNSKRSITKIKIGDHYGPAPNIPPHKYRDIVENIWQKDECIPEDIISVIEKNIVWDFIESIAEYDNIKIQPFVKTE